MNKQRRGFSAYHVKPHLQLKFGLVIMLCMSLVALFVWVQGSLAIRAAASLHPAADTVLQMQLLNATIAKTFIIGLALAFGLSLFFSHFVAGPIYRFERVLEQMREGRLDLYIQLRKYDELKEVADLFNQAISSLRNRVREERETTVAAAEKAAALAASLKKAGHAAEAKELNRVLAEITSAPTKITF